MALGWAYFDTSALVKRYIREPGSEQVRALLRQHETCLSLSVDATEWKLSSAVSLMREAS